MSRRIDPSRTTETLVLNAQKGEPYRVKLEGDPTVLEGIPLSKPGDTTHDVGAFRMEVTAPPGRAGVLHGQIGDIEWIERVR